MRFVLNRSALRLRVALYPKVIFFSSSVIPTNNGCFVARYTAPRLHHPRLPPPQTSSSASSMTSLSCSCLVLGCFAFWLIGDVAAVHDFLLRFRGPISPPVSAHASLVLVVTVTPAASISCTNALAESSKPGTGDAQSVRSTMRRSWPLGQRLRRSRVEKATQCDSAWPQTMTRSAFSRRASKVIL